MEHHLACTAQTWGRTGMGQVFTFSCGRVVEYCASKNAATSGFQSQNDASPCLRTLPPADGFLRKIFSQWMDGPTLVSY